MEFPYPGSPDGKLPVPEGCGLPDTVATFAFLAGVTKNLRFGTGISLIPQRNPIYTAKEFATLDWLTQGRIDLGVGVGWCKEEVLACGYGWADRGERCDEQLDLMIKLWTQPVITHQGKHFQLPAACRADPKPVQKPHIPLIIGGYSKPAMRRTVTYGNGWIGFGGGARQSAPAIAMVEAALAEAGRKREDFEIVVAPIGIGEDDIRAFVDLGVDRLVPITVATNPERITEQLKQLERFATIAG
jgi:probable F420-dependent oxidoreductase